MPDRREEDGGAVGSPWLTAPSGDTVTNQIKRLAWVLSNIECRPGNIYWNHFALPNFTTCLVADHYHVNSGVALFYPTLTDLHIAPKKSTGIQCPLTSSCSGVASNRNYRCHSRFRR